MEMHVIDTDESGFRCQRTGISLGLTAEVGSPECTKFEFDTRSYS
jgi:hypothetical protein